MLRHKRVDRLDRHKEEEEKMKVKVKLVSHKILKDYAGMNYYAAKTLHFHPFPKKDEIFVDRDMKKKDIKETVRHEKLERKLMGKGCTYWNAHKKALRAER